MQVPVTEVMMAGGVEVARDSVGGRMAAMVSLGTVERAMGRMLEAEVRVEAAIQVSVAEELMA